MPDGTDSFRIRQGRDALAVEGYLNPRKTRLSHLPRGSMACHTIHVSTDEELIEAARERRGPPLPDPVVRRLLRQRAHVSQAELAEVLGVRPSAISRWESGVRDPNPAVRGRYAQLLDRLAREAS